MNNNKGKIMTDEQIGKAFLECEDHWIWLPGMLPLARDADGDWVAEERVWRSQGGYLSVGDQHIPDITDPITAWGTLELVKRAGAFIIKLSVLPMGCNLIVEWPDSIIDSYRGKTLAEITLQALSDAQDRGYKQ